MGKYVRKTIYVTVDQDQLLRRRAAEQGVSVSAIVRALLDEMIEHDSDAKSSKQ